jgi:hypothetical protein
MTAPHAARAKIRCNFDAVIACILHFFLVFFNPFGLFGADRCGIAESNSHSPWKWENGEFRNQPPGEGETRKQQTRGSCETSRSAIRFPKRIIRWRLRAIEI